MWIKNLQQYLLAGKWSLSAADLEDKLGQALCRDCGPQELRTEGFVPPLKGYDRLVYASDGLLLCCYQEVTRLLPSTVIRELLDERVEELEARENRKIGRKERADLKDQVVFEALPKAFTRSRRTFVIIDTRLGRVLVDASAAKLAEQVTETLRKAVGSLPLSLPQSNLVPAAEMTGWLRAANTMPAYVGLGDRCELRDGGNEGPVVRATGIDLLGGEVKVHLDAGMQLAKVNLTWKDLLEFDLAEDLSIKRIRPLDQLKSEMDDQDVEDAEAELLATLTIQGSTLREVLDVISEAMGVEKPAVNLAA